MLQHTDTASTLDTCLRAIVTPDESSEHYSASDCQIGLANDVACVRVEFPERRVPTLAIGQRVRLQLDRGDDIEVFDAFAKAISWRMAEGVHTYELHVEAGHAKELANLVGVRSDERLRVDLQDPVRAAVSTPDGRARREGKLLDVSRQGCAIAFESEEPWMLEAKTPLLVHLELFPGEALTVLAARLRTRRVSSLAVAHGFLLAPDENLPQTTPAGLAAESLERFLEMRRRELRAQAD